MNKFTIPWWRISFGDDEIRGITRAINNENISQGPVVAEFERLLAAYLGVPYVVATTSGSIALLMSIMAAGVGYGDEVIVPNRTWIATAHAPAMLGAKVVLVDVETDRPIIDTNKIEKVITPRTKAIMPVHMNGRSANMREINRIARKNGLKVIEDAAQALGSSNGDGLLGTQSDMGCFSLSVTKIIAAGQGGFIATRDHKLYEKLVAIRTHGVGSVIDAEWTQLGFNFRFTDILASIGIAQLGCLDERIEKVRSIYLQYREGIKDLPYLSLIPVNIEAGEVPVYVEALCKERDRLINFFAENGIQSRPFYADLNMASYLQEDGNFSNCVQFSKQGIYLPSGPSQSFENINRVIKVMHSFV